MIIVYYYNLQSYDTSFEADSGPTFTFNPFQPLFQLLVGALQTQPLLAIALFSLLYGLAQTQILPVARSLGLEGPLCALGCSDGFRILSNCDSVCRGEFVCKPKA